VESVSVFQNIEIASQETVAGIDICHAGILNQELLTATENLGHAHTLLFY